MAIFENLEELKPVHDKEGLVMSPEFIYYTGSATETMPNADKHGYLSFVENANLSSVFFFCIDA